MIDLVSVICETLPGCRISASCDLTKLHEKTIRGTAEEVLAMLRANEKAEKGEYCLVLDLHDVHVEEGKAAYDTSLEARIFELLMAGRDMREAGDALCSRAKNATMSTARAPPCRNSWKNFGRMMTMKNETIELLYNRKSVRAYEKREIPEEDVQKILRAAIEAPTAGNMTLWSAIRVTDEAKKKRLSETCDNQPFIASAPLVLVFCADYKRWYDLFGDAGFGRRAAQAGRR